MMDNETLKAKATELYKSGMGYIKIASELGIDRDKVRRLLGKKHRNSESRFKPSKLHVPLELRLINILAYLHKFKNSWSSSIKFSKSFLLLNWNCRPSIGLMKSRPLEPSKPYPNILAASGDSSELCDVSAFS